MWFFKTSVCMASQMPDDVDDEEKRGGLRMIVMNVDKRSWKKTCNLIYL